MNERITSERMTSPEFQQWVSDMGYPSKVGLTSVEKVPYDPTPICDDLGIRANRFYAYWRGIEKGKVVRVSPSVTRLCYALLARRRTITLLASIRAGNPQMAGIVDQILAHMETPRFRTQPRRKAVEIDDSSRREAESLREQAVQLRRQAQTAPTGSVRDLYRSMAVTLENQALKVERDAQEAARRASEDPAQSDDGDDFDILGDLD